MIELLCFGPLDVRADDGQPIGRVLAQPKRAALLAYLVLARPRGFHRRDQLVALFWPELDQEHARRSLNQALTFLRRELAGLVIVTRGPEEVGVNAARISCDVVAFERALASGDRRIALDLYRAELLSGLHVADAPDFADWVDRERERLRGLAAEAAGIEADADRAGERVGDALALARLALDLGPYDEAALRRVLTLLDERGDRAGAVLTYEAFRVRLASQLETEPSPETKALIEKLRARTAPLDEPHRAVGEERVEAGDFGGGSSSLRGENGAAITFATPSDATPPTMSARDGSRAPRALRIATGSVVGIGLAAVVYAGFIRADESASPRLPVGDAAFITSMDGFETRPDLSRAGDRIVFEWVGSAARNRRIMLVSASGGTPLELTDGQADDSHPTWSPGGREVAFLRLNEAARTHDIMTVPAQGGPVRRLGTALPRGLDWSPDGTLLAFADRPGPDLLPRIYLLSLETGERRQLSRAADGVPGLVDSDPSFSPDGRSIAFIRYASASGGTGTLHTQRLDDSASIAMNEEDWIWDVEWVPRGAGWIVAAGDPSSRHLTLVSPAAEPRRLPLGQGALHLTVSASTGAIAYVEHTQDHDIWRTPGPTAMQRSAAELLIRSTRDDLMPAYSPDGSRLSFISAQSGAWEVWVADSDGNGQRQLTDLGHALFPSWSRDGESIVFSSTRPRVPSVPSDVLVVDAAGGLPRNVTEDDRGDAIPSWSSDDWLYYQSRPGEGSWQIWRKRALDGPPELVVDEPSTLLRPIAAANGDLYYFDLAKSQLWRRSARAGTAQQVLASVSSTGFAEWTIWNDRVVYLEHDDSASHIDMLDPATGRTTRLADVPRLVSPAARRDANQALQFLPALTVSPDGRWIAYTLGRAGSDLVLWRHPW